MTASGDGQAEEGHPSREASNNTFPARQRRFTRYRTLRIPVRSGDGCLQLMGEAAGLRVGHTCHFPHFPIRHRICLRSQPRAQLTLSFFRFFRSVVLSFCLPFRPSIVAFPIVRPSYLWWTRCFRPCLRPTLREKKTLFFPPPPKKKPLLP